MSAAPKYAFVDRDGTLIHEPPGTRQIDSVAKLRLLDGVVEGLLLLRRRGYRLVLVSNQDGLGTPAFPQAAFAAPHAELMRRLNSKGIQFEREFICPHTPEDGCGCRKPRTGLLDDFLRATRLDRGKSFVCGDRESDRQLALNIGVRFVPMETNGSFGQAMRAFAGKGEAAMEGIQGKAST